MNKNWIYYLTHKRNRGTRVNNYSQRPNISYIDNNLHSLLDTEETNDTFIRVKEEEFVYKTPCKNSDRAIKTPKTPHNRRQLALENDIPILRINLLPIFQNN